MTMKKTITLDVEMFSGASEAAMYDHMEAFCANVVQSAKEAAMQSWNRELATDWDERYTVEITVEERESK